MTILVLEGLHGQTRHLVAVNSSTQQINYDPCLNVKILTKQDLQTHFSLLVPEWRNWRPWFPRHLSCFGSSYTIWNLFNSESEASVPSSSSSITSATASCLLLTLRVSRAGSNIALFSSRVPAGPSSHYFFGQNISSRCKSYHHTLFLCSS